REGANKSASFTSLQFDGFRCQEPIRYESSRRSRRDQRISRCPFPAVPKDRLPAHLRLSQPHAVHQGSANAISESPRVVPSLPCPPAAMTTYCLPFSSYVIGIA